MKNPLGPTASFLTIFILATLILAAIVACDTPQANTGHYRRAFLGRFSAPPCHAAERPSHEPVRGLVRGVRENVSTAKPTTPSLGG